MDQTGTNENFGFSKDIQTSRKLTADVHVRQGMDHKKVVCRYQTPIKAIFTCK